MGGLELERETDLESVAVGANGLGTEPGWGRGITFGLTWEAKRRNPGR